MKVKGFYAFSEQLQERMINYCSNFSEVAMDAMPQVEEMRGWIVRGVEIFKAGTYRGIQFGEDALDEMVSNFKTLKQSGAFEPVFKKNHSESVDDQIGWIVDCYREGDILKGDLHITEWMAMDKIENKTWKYVSSEIYPPELAAEEFDGITGHVLRGVAIVSVPKVKGLKGIVLNSEIIDQGGNIVDKAKLLAMLAKLGINFSEEEAKDLTEEQLEERLTARFAEVRTPAPNPAVPAVTDAAKAAGVAAFGEGQFVVVSQDDFSAMVQKAAGSEQKQLDLFAEITTLKNESKAVKIERKISALMTAGKVTPAEKDDIKSFAEKLEGESFDNYFNTFEKRTPVVAFGESGGNQGGDPDDDDKAWESFQELNKKKTFE